ESHCTSVLAKARSVMVALAVCLAGYSGTAPMLGADLKQTVSGSNSDPVSPAPVIRALTAESGSREIQWNTGNGSPGFVFVTENGGSPVLFSKRSRGNHVAPLIGKQRDVFELYQDDQTRALLAKVIVSGSDGRASSKRSVSWQAVARWVLIVGLAAVLYFTVYLSSTGPVRTSFPLEPATSPRPLYVGRNLLLGIAAFMCVDGLIFH